MTLPPPVVEPSLKPLAMSEWSIIWGGMGWPLLSASIGQRPWMLLNTYSTQASPLPPNTELSSPKCEQCRVWEALMWNMLLRLPNAQTVPGGLLCRSERAGTGETSTKPPTPWPWGWPPPCPACLFPTSSSWPVSNGTTGRTRHGTNHPQPPRSTWRGEHPEVGQRGEVRNMDRKEGQSTSPLPFLLHSLHWIPRKSLYLGAKDKEAKYTVAQWSHKESDMT